jgi:hypothetical protein
VCIIIKIIYYVLIIEAALINKNISDDYNNITL